MLDSSVDAHLHQKHRMTASGQVCRFPRTSPRVGQCVMFLFCEMRGSATATKLSGSEQ